MRTCVTGDGQPGVTGNTDRDNAFSFLPSFLSFFSTQCVCPFVRVVATRGTPEPPPTKYTQTQIHICLPEARTQLPVQMLYGVLVLGL